MIYIVVITVKSCREDVLEILRRNGYTQAGFDGFKGTVAEKYRAYHGGDIGT